MARRPTRARSRWVTLSSDVGPAYAAQMKAVLAHRLEPGRLIDLTHDLPRHAVREAAFLVRAMAMGFPRGTVHLVIVDPGVGGRRAPIVVRCADGSLLVGPDNGVLGLLADALGRPEVFRLDRRKVSPRARVGTTFDGRDLFAPAAARLATGTPPDRIGTRVRSLVRIEGARPRRLPGGAAGEVLHVDPFGNLITSIPTEWIPRDCRELRARLGLRRTGVRLPVTSSYESIPQGRPGALGSSFGLVEISVSHGSAAERFRMRTGSRVRLDWGRSPRGQ